MPMPKIGQSTFQPESSTPSEPEIRPGGRDLTQDAHVDADLWIENPFGDVPAPPASILRKLATQDRVWRWLSTPQVKKNGMRNYETYSPDPEDRDAIDRGRCAAGLAISTDNRVTWREDAWLATIPRKRWLERQAERRRRTDQQSRLAKSPEPLAAVADRLGAKSSLTVQERVGGGEFR